MSKEEVRQKLDLAELIGGYVQLKPVGHGRFTGLCPFHKEKSPSFQVDTQRGFFHCFGCKAGGDAFGFLQQIENIPFREALERLALRTGVQLEHRPKEKHHRDIYEVNELALGYFRDHLDAEITAYLVGRGIYPELIKRFELGYAPNGWDGLIQHAKARGTDERQLKQAGLISENESGRVYDKFRHRVMFPIRDALGRLVGFGGRVLDDSKPKYLNTPETDVFKKGELLYGLNLAGKRSELIIVEGYLDVIAMHGVGYTQTVATLGTSLTADHTYLLARQGVSKLSLLFDADDAGRKATLSGLDQTLGSQLEVKALTLPNGKDPADAVLAGDIAGIQSALRNGLDEVALRLELACGGVDIATNGGKELVLTRLLPRMQQAELFSTADSVAERLRRLTAERLGIDEKRLADWVGRKASKKPAHIPTPETGTANQRERLIAAYLLQNPGRMPKALDIDGYTSTLLRQILSQSIAPIDPIALASENPEARELLMLTVSGEEFEAALLRRRIDLIRQEMQAEMTAKPPNLPRIAALRGEIEALRRDL